MRVGIIIAALALPTGGVAGEDAVWTADLRPAEKALSLQVRDDRSSWGQSVPLAALVGLGEAADGAAGFTLTREAGTLSFEGSFRAGRGAGHVHFESSPAYAGEMAVLGFPQARDQRPFELALLDLGPRKVRAYQALGVTHLGWDDLFALTIHDGSPAYIEGMRALGLPAKDARRIVELRIHDVSPAYVKELREVGLAADDEQSLIELRVHGVTGDYCRKMRALGLGELTATQLRDLRIHGVTPAFVEELQGLKVQAKGSEDYTRLRIHGVTPELVRRLHAAGYVSLTADDLVRLRIHGIDEVLEKGGARPTGGR